jgi:DNA-binding NarL/FixJ family response regulator
MNGKCRKHMARKTKPEAQSGKRIYIVEDHPLFREGLKAIIRSEPALTVCGESGDAAQAFREIGQLKPDVVTLDIGLSGKSGLELLKDIQSVHPDLPVIVISMHDENLFAPRVLRAGGRGYLMKHSTPGMLLQAIERVLSGQIFVSHSIATLILDSLARPGVNSSLSPVARLTDRELEVLRLIGKGKDGHEIASTLHMGIKTVDTHRGRIKEKLGLKGGTALIHFATQWATESA